MENCPADEEPARTAALGPRPLLARTPSQLLTPTLTHLPRRL